MTGKQAAPSASALERAFRYNRPWLHLLLAGAKVATGQTPKKVIWAKNKATLYRYVPRGETRFPVPVLLVYALIDRPFILDLVQHNKLVKGEFRLRGRLVDLKDITCPLLSIAGTQDLICRVPQAEAIMGLAGSQDKEFCVLQGGHIGMLAGAEAKQGLWLKVQRWLEARSQ